MGVIILQFIHVSNQHVVHVNKDRRNKIPYLENEWKKYRLGKYKIVHRKIIHYIQRQSYQQSLELNHTNQFYLTDFVEHPTQQQQNMHFFLSVQRYSKKDHIWGLNSAPVNFEKFKHFKKIIQE